MSTLDSLKMKRKKVASIREETFHMPCKVFGCNHRAKYRIGNVEGIPNAMYHVCQDCLDEIIESLPEESKPVKVVEKEVEKIVVQELTVSEARQIVEEADERNKKLRESRKEGK